MGKDLESKLCEEQLRSLGLFSPERRRLRGGPNTFHLLECLRSSPSSPSWLTLFVEVASLKCLPSALGTRSMFSWIR